MVPKIYRDLSALGKFSTTSELRISSSADFGVGENDQLLIKEKQRPLILRAKSLIGV